LAFKLILYQIGYFYSSMYKNYSVLIGKTVVKMLTFINFAFNYYNPTVKTVELKHI